MVSTNYKIFLNFFELINLQVLVYFLQGDFLIGDKHLVMSFCSIFSPFLTLMGDSGGGLSLASKLRSLSSENFVLLLSAIFNIVQVRIHKYFSWTQSFVSFLMMYWTCFDFSFNSDILGS